jgi:general secretion pathway protein G
MLRRGYTIVELMLTIVIAGIVVSLGVISYRAYLERVDIAKAGQDIAVISAQITEFKKEWGRFPTNLGEVGMAAMADPWGHGYQYVDHTDTANRGNWRKDKNIVPINSDFDLFSMGKDGSSVPPLTAATSRDDIIRANDGAFIGLASRYDP